MDAPRRPAQRWALVAVLAALVVGVPTAVQVLPPRDSAVGAAALLAQVRAAEDRPWSGYVETQGTLQVPSVEDVAEVGRLLGERTRLRAWWRSDDDWRVDRLLQTGESDLLQRDGVSVEWSYERAEADVFRDPDVRLPRAADLVPPVLAERVLRGVEDADVERLPSRRVAGTAAPGLRVRPAAPQASVDHVDLWVDPATGVPLRVDVHGSASGPPDFTTAFGDFSAERPPASVTAFEPTATTEVEVDEVLDIADAADQFAPLRPPAVVGGLARSGASDGAVGVYGTGLVQLLAVPLRSREADALREQLRATVGTVEVASPTALRIALGPLGLLVTGEEDEGAWLVTGTVTGATLERAARDLLTGTRVVEEAGE